MAPGQDDKGIEGFLIGDWGFDKSWQLAAGSGQLFN
jgi:hypothetical protein